MSSRLSPLLLFTVALISHPAIGEDALQQSFDDQAPGEWPRAWRHAWGPMGDDLVVVTNLESVSGRQSFLLDRASGTNKAQWGVQTALPSFEAGWAFLAFAFRIEGKGANAHIGIELRNGSKRALALGFRFNTLSVRTYQPKPPAELRGGKLGRYKSGQWYRVRLWLPTRFQTGPKAWAGLETLTAKGSVPMGKPIPVACTVAQGPSPLFMLNLTPNRRGFRFFLDDLLCHRVATLPFRER